MTDREKAIVMAYTGVCMLKGDKFDIFHKYVEDIMGRPVYTHEFSEDRVIEEIKNKAYDDLIELCKDDNSETKWITEIEEWLPKQTGTYLVAIAIPLKTSSEPRYIATSAYYSKRENTWTLSKEYADGKVIAWMPLPEPYIKIVREEKTRWIPVTEKLPEKECDCLVTTRRRYNTSNNLEVVSCSYYPDMRSKWFLDGGGDAKNVIAWMPLPEPYEPESEVEK